MISLVWTKAKLAEWGRWVRADGIGYPTHSAHETIRIGSVFSIDRDLPDDLQAVDVVIVRAPPDIKAILVEHYTKQASIRQHAARLGLKRSTYFDRKEHAEMHVCRELT